MEWRCSEMENFEVAEKLFFAIMEALDNTEVENPKFWTDSEKIMSKDKAAISGIADLLDDVAGCGVCCTGYYDPEEDKRNGEVDKYTGYYYLELAE